MSPTESAIVPPETDSDVLAVSFRATPNLTLCVKAPDQPQVVHGLVQLRKDSILHLFSAASNDEVVVPHGNESHQRA
jgi:hypothetical protein